MANEEKTKEDHPFSLPASDPVNTTVFDSPAVKHKLRIDNHAQSSSSEM